MCFRPYVCSLVSSLMFWFGLCFNISNLSSLNCVLVAAAQAYTVLRCCCRWSTSSTLVTGRLVLVSSAKERRSFPSSHQCLPRVLGRAVSQTLPPLSSNTLSLTSLSSYSITPPPIMDIGTLEERLLSYIIES